MEFTGSVDETVNRFLRSRNLFSLYAINLTIDLKAFVFITMVRGFISTEPSEAQQSEFSLSSLSEHAIVCVTGRIPCELFPNLFHLKQSLHHRLLSGFFCNPVDLLSNVINRFYFVSSSVL